MISETTIQITKRTLRAVIHTKGIHEMGSLAEMAQDALNAIEREENEQYQAEFTQDLRDQGYSTE